MTMSDLEERLIELDRLRDEIDKADDISIRIRGERLTNQEISEFIDEWYEEEVS